MRAIQTAVGQGNGPLGNQRGTLGRMGIVFGSGTVLAIVVAASFTPPGMAAASAVFWFLEFYSGALSLVALSLTVMGGLLATDRLVLLIRHRVLLYAVHRALATTAMAFLAVHVLTKIAEQHATVVDVFIPFMNPDRPLWVGLGTVGAYLMTLAAWTGVVRARFAGSARPWMWRALHIAAYVCWPINVVHGLLAGRAAKTWVTVSYVLCIALVVVALVVRLALMWGKRQTAPKAQTTGTIKPVGRLGSERRRSSTQSFELGLPPDDAPVAAPRVEPVLAGAAGPGYAGGYPPVDVPAYTPGYAAPGVGGRSGEYPPVGRATGEYPPVGRTGEYPPVAPAYDAAEEPRYPQNPPQPPRPPRMRPDPPRMRPEAPVTATPPRGTAAVRGSEQVGGGAPMGGTGVPVSPGGTGTGSRSRRRRFSDEEGSGVTSTTGGWTVADYWGTPADSGRSRGGRRRAPDGDRGASDRGASDWGASDRGASDWGTGGWAAGGAGLSDDLAGRFLGEAPMSPAPMSPAPMAAAPAPGAAAPVSGGSRWRTGDPTGEQPELIDLPQRMRDARSGVSDDTFWGYLHGGALR